MGDNGKTETAAQVNNNEPKVLIEISALPDGSMALRSGLPPQTVVYVLEQMKFNMFIQEWQKHQSSLIKPAGGIVNFVRDGFRKK